MVILTTPAIFDEPLRPQFHFTAPTGWLNDPNGLVYQDGKYHMFYQHNPFSTQWGNMTWGHAVSTDLIHWEHLPLAIEPDEFGTIYSGSAVVDHSDSLGMGRDTLVCFYTAAGGYNEASKGVPFTQRLAYSRDGKTFTKLPGSPLVAHIVEENRDPKVFWHEPTKRWVMVLYLRGSSYAIFGSKDLREWSKLSEFELRGSGECPDLVQLPLDGDGKKSSWVFWGADGAYQVGDFDGRQFLPKTALQHSYFGNTAYAAQTYSNAPDNRCIQISWFRGSEFPGTAWNQQMGFPHTLSLRSTESGPKLFFWPVKEIHSIRKPKISAKGGLYTVKSGLIDFEGEWDVPSSGVLELEVNGVPIVFDAVYRRLSVLGRDVQVPIRKGKLKIRGLVDRASLELYVQDGEILMPFFVLPKAGTTQGLKVKGDWTGSLSVYELSP